MPKINIFSDAEAENEWIMDNGDYHLASEDRDGNLYYTDRRHAEINESTAISSKALQSRDVAKSFGLKALAGSTARQKSFGEHLRLEVIRKLNPEIVVGLRGLKTAKDYADRSRSIQSGDVSFFKSYAENNADAEMKLDRDHRERIDAKKRKKNSSIIIRIKKIAASNQIDLDINRVFYGDEQKWAPLSELSDDVLLQYIVAKKDLAGLSTNDPRWRSVRDSIKDSFGFYI